jgi:hypothetical protein
MPHGWTDGQRASTDGQRAFKGRIDCNGNRAHGNGIVGRFFTIATTEATGFSETSDRLL